MQFSIIIPTCNRNDLLVKCLDKLEPTAQTYTAAYEVIVTDDSNNFITRDLILQKFNWARWIQGPMLGPAANRNSGAKAANGDWIIFIDDDCLPDSMILKAYSFAITDGLFGAFEGKVIAEREQKRFDEQSPINLTGGKFWSCNIAIKKSIFFEIHGFDEGFPYPALEDTDIYHRLKKITNIAFVNNAFVVHPFRRAKPFNNYKKWIASSKYALKKSGTIVNFNYRLVRVKIFITSIFSPFGDLIRYKFKGFIFYIEIIVSNFIMIFIKI